LITGDPRSGKSWITGLFCEQLILQGYCLCIIDPEGDYAPLESLPGVVVFSAERPLPPVDEIARALRFPDVNVVIDLHSIWKRYIVKSYQSNPIPVLATQARNHKLSSSENTLNMNSLNSSSFTKPGPEQVFVAIAGRPPPIELPQLVSKLHLTITDPASDVEPVGEREREQQVPIFHGDLREGVGKRLTLQLRLARGFQRMEDQARQARAAGGKKYEKH
jgi:hypothetical protein